MKSWWNFVNLVKLANVVIRLVKSWWNFVKLVKLVKSWWNFTKLVKRLWIFIKLGSWWKVGEKSCRKFQFTNFTNSRAQEVFGAKFRPVRSVFAGEFSEAECCWKGNWGHPQSFNKNKTGILCVCARVRVFFVGVFFSCLGISCFLARLGLNWVSAGVKWCNPLWGEFVGEWFGNHLGASHH